MASLRILHLEDNSFDADLLRRSFVQEGLECDILRVSGQVAFEQALEGGRFDLIISDYAIPGWNGLEALSLVRRRDSRVPFIFFSGALGEERAVEALKCGATDYVLKHRLPRLLPVVRRALAEIEDHRRREQAESSLREAEARYRILFEQLPEPLVVVDPQTTGALEFNDEACRQFGYSRAEFSRLHLRDHVGLEHPGSLESSLAAALNTGRAEFETAYRTRSGQSRNVWVTVRVVEIQGRPALHSIWRDITQRQETERRLLRSQRLESIGTLAGGIAHDLNNALAPILMSASLLRQGASAENAALLDLIDTSAQRGAAMVRQLLTFAKGIEGQRILIQPKHLFRELEKIIKGTFPKNLQLEVRIAREGAVVLGDATQLHQVLLNLCVNARDAMPEGGILTLETGLAQVDTAQAQRIEGAKPGRYVIMRVADSGTGIAPDILDRIFDPFFTTKGPEKGTGMGLSTVLGIVRSHHGFIELDSTPGRGSIFSVYLPPAEGGKADTEVVHRVEEFQANGELVLVVDDDAAVRRSVEMLLQRLNFRPLASASGHEALVSFAQRRSEIELILCDLHMPHMDGVILVQALRRMAPQARVVVMSGNPSERQVTELKSVGVDAVLTKPFAPKQLIETLQAITAGGQVRSSKP